MTYRKSLIGLALFTILAVVVTWLVSATLLREVGAPSYTYTAVFTDLTGLHAGDDVRMAGVRVGRVDRIGLRGADAEVEFRVRTDQRLYTDTTASVTYQNIIGQRYLGLNPGGDRSPQPLANHGQIPLDHTEPSFDITYLLRGFEPLFTLLDPTQVDNMTSAIVQALQGDNGSVLTLITQTSLLAQSVAGPDQVLGDLITSLSSVVTNLAEQNSKLQTVITQSRDLIVGLNARKNELRSSVGSITSTVGRLATITESVFPYIDELITREPGFTGQLTGDGRDRAAYLTANLPAVLKGISRVFESGSYGSLYVCDLNSTLFAFLGRLIPAIVRNATPGNTLKHSAKCR